MKLHDFITHKEIENISNCIKNEVSFSTYENTIKGYTFMITNSRAVGDWSKWNVKDGDYIVSIRIFTTKSGTSSPYGGEKLKEFHNPDKFKKYLDNYLKDGNIKGYKTIDEGQIDLFNLAMEG